MSFMEERRPKPCVKCGAEVEGKVEGVAVTLCCAKCCQRRRLPRSALCQGQHRISSSVAKRDFGCTPASLRTINHERVKHTGCEVKLYLLAEVEHLGNKCAEGTRTLENLKQTKRPTGALASESELDPSAIATREDKQKALRPKQRKAVEKKSRRAQQKRQEEQAIKEKIAYVEGILHCKLSCLDTVVRYFLLGDFLTKSKNTKMTAEDIQCRCGVLDRVQTILSECPCAHPDAAFTFCLEHPDEGPEEFQELKEKTRSVFRLEGFRILHFAKVDDCDASLSHLVITPLLDIYDRFKVRNPVQIVRTHLLKWFDDATSDEIVKHPILRKRIRFGGPEDRLAEELMECWNTKEERVQKLEAALEAKGFHMPKEFYASNPFVYGAPGCSFQEAVGTVEVIALLQLMDFCPCSLRLAIPAFVQTLRCEGCSYDEAVEEAIAAAMRTCFICDCIYVVDDVPEFVD